MTPADLARLHARAFAHDRPWSEAEFASLLDAPRTEIATDAHAFALGRRVLDEFEVLTVAVDPAHRNHGLGRATLARLLDKAEAQGAATAFLEVAEDNAPALRLYQASGFHEIGRRRGYYARRDGPAVDALVLSRTLSPSDAPNS